MRNKRNFIIINSVLGALLIFLIILIKLGLTTAFDTNIYNFWAQFINPNVTKIFKIITFCGSTLFIVGISIVLFFVLGRKSRGKEYAITIIIATIFSSILKLLIARPRPDVLKLVVENTYSFPSGHTIAITTLCGFLIYLILKEWGSITKIGRICLISLLISLALLVMISRIYLGAHFATDIIGGLICSLIVLNNCLTYFSLKNS